MNTENNDMFEVTELNYGGRLTGEKLEAIVRKNANSCPSDAVIVDGYFVNPIGAYWDDPIVWYDFDPEELGSILTKIETEITIKTSGKNNFMEEFMETSQEVMDDLKREGKMTEGSCDFLKVLLDVLMKEYRI